MSISLYDASIGSYLQVVDACAKVLAKGAEWAGEQGIDLPKLVDTRLRDDMHPLRFQVVSVWHHSLGAIRGLEAGVFSPPPAMPDADYAGLQGLVAEAAAGLRRYTPAQVDAWRGKPVKFKLDNFELPFTAENFILTFSLPNFYFHATATYCILRLVGVPLGKLDFLGQMRVAS